MQYNTVSGQILQELASVTSESQVIPDRERMIDYTGDEFAYPVTPTGSLRNGVRSSMDQPGTILLADAGGIIALVVLLAFAALFGAAAWKFITRGRSASARTRLGVKPHERDEEEDEEAPQEVSRPLIAPKTARPVCGILVSAPKMRFLGA